MLERLKLFLETHQLLQVGDKVLLAVSGGVDSVALAHLLSRTGVYFALAHCNFQLRDEASDGDEVFVEQLAKKLGCPFFSTRFDTQNVMQERGQSMQVVARELRYEWLEKIRQENDYQYIATAHHLNDSIETALYNFTKGTGIRGLHGIPHKNGAIIRPLLFATRTEIETYLAVQGLTHREDHSNQERKYSRNKIRLDVIPVLKEINPGLEKTMQQNFQHLRETQWLFEFAVAQFREKWVREMPDGFSIQILPLRKHPAGLTLLHEWLSPCGFTSDQLENALIENTQTGAIFYSESHRLLVDRDQLFVQEYLPELTQFELLETDSNLRLDRMLLEIEYKEGQPESFLLPEEGLMVDHRLLVYPLTVRRWQAGDVFQPLGMTGHQKVQDFFSNLKLSRFEKENAWILENGDGQIIGILSYRLDDRFKITPKTVKYMKMTLRQTD